MREIPNISILDGGMSSALKEVDALLEFDKNPLFTAHVLASSPSCVYSVHKRYLEAGSTIISTNTYQATVSGFQKHLGLTEDGAMDLIRKGARLAIDAREEFCTQANITECPLVAGSVGPYGAWLHDGSEYSGNYIDNMDINEIRLWHKPRIQALLEAGVDLLAFETMPCSQEPTALAAMLSEEFPAARAWVTYQSNDGVHTCHGERLSDAAAELQCYEQIVGVGVNCVDPRVVESCIKQFEPLRHRMKIIVYPNSGESWRVKDGWHGDVRLDFTADVISRWVDAGATWIGGCCRVYPHHIQTLRTVMSKYM